MICPNCGLEHQTIGEHTDHVERAHSNVLVPGKPTAEIADKLLSDSDAMTKTTTAGLDVVFKKEPDGYL